MTDITVNVSIDPEDRDRIDALIAALGDKKGKAPAKKAAAKKPAAEKPAASEHVDGTEDKPAADDAPEGPTRGEVRTKLKEHAALEGKEAAIKILNDHGAASITELDESEFAAVIAACDG